MKLESLFEAIPQQRGLAPFIRKASGVKGKTEHTGRGSWWMHANEPYDWDVMVQNLFKKLPQWKRSGHLVDAARDGEDGLVLIFSQKYFNPHYRTFSTRRPENEFKKMIGTIPMSFSMPQRLIPDDVDIEQYNPIRPFIERGYRRIFQQI